MLYVSKRMTGTPEPHAGGGRVALHGMKDKLVKDNMDEDMARKWFPLVCTLFVFIWFSNMIGYLPLPVNSEHKVNVFGATSRRSRSTPRPRTSRSRSSCR